MRTGNIAILLIASLVLTGCGFGQSRLNPFNWFGTNEAAVETVEDVVIVESADPRPLIPEITSLVIERTPGGAIIRATGLPPVQGWHNAALVSENRGRPVGGILTFAFRAMPPQTPTRVSTEASRAIVVARFVSNITLSETSQIVVTGARNARTLRP